MAEIEQPLIPQEPLMDTGALPIPPYTPPDLTKPHKSQSLAPTTTVAQDEVVAGQRKINLIWETSQSRIALWVVGFTTFIDGLVSVILVITGRDITVGQTFGLSFLNLICGIVISFYFSRTNHTQTGGIGEKATDTQQYKGR